MARSFNGTTDFITADAAATYNVNINYSASCWVNAAKNATERCFFSEGRSSSTQLFLEWYNQSASSGKCGFRLQSATANIVSIASTATVFDGTWHHVCCTQDSSGNWVLYVDGALDHSGTHVTTNPAVANQLSIGVFRRSTNTFFYAGLVAEVAKWSRTLAANEALALANGLPASHLAPDHYWPLWGADSPEPDIGTGTHATGTLTGTTAANSARVGLGLVAFT